MTSPRPRRHPASRPKPRSWARAAPPAAPIPDAFDCYELCVQDGSRMARFLHALHGRLDSPRPARTSILRPTLREDFSGTGAAARAWCALSPRHRAIAIDLDPAPLARLRQRAEESNINPNRLAVRRADATRTRTRADVIAATNFAVGYCYTRDQLLGYFSAARAALRPAGIFVCDTYGGATAFQTGTLTRDRFTPGGLRVRQIWEQRRADPISARVIDAIHFRIDRAGDVLADYPDAFVYDWRLWSIPELRDTLAEAGFAASEVHADLGDAEDQTGRLYATPVTSSEDLEESYVVCIVARTA